VRGQAAGDGEDFAIWPDNAETLELFLACRTQWRVAGSAHGLICLGLDYAGVEVVMRAQRVKKQEWKDVFNGVQQMEFAALKEWL